MVAVVVVVIIIIMMMMMVMVMVKKKMMMTIADLQITQYKSCSRRCSVVKDSNKKKTPDRDRGIKTKGFC